MKKIYFIGILAFLVFAVGSASATVTQFYWTEANANQGGLPAGTIKILVTYDDTTSQLSFKSLVGSAGYLTEPKIFWVGYNLKNTDGIVTAKTLGQVLTTATWSQISSDVNPNNMDGFGNFYRIYRLDQEPLRPDEVIVNLPSNTGIIPVNNKNNIIAIHLAWTDIRDLNGNVIYGPGSTNLGPDSTYISGPGINVPEFSTMVFPVAAIIGLLFITQRKRKEE